MTVQPAVDPTELHRNLSAFVSYRNSHLNGHERKEASLYLERLFQSFGHTGIAEAGATLEEAVNRGAKGVGFADLVWKPRVLIEMKKSGTDLGRHYQQAFSYWTHLVPDRPRYVILCNFDEFWIYDFDAQVDEPVDRLRISDLPSRWEALAFLLPRPQTPQFGNDLVAVTKWTAANVARLFNMLVERGVERAMARRFILQSVMAMFAEDIRLLPTHTFTAAVTDTARGQSAYDLLFGGLFREMNTPGSTPAGRFSGTPYFNGGLYATIEPFELTPDECEALLQACQTDWSQVRPEIFGTLFEQSLGKAERHAFGAHYTSPADIARIIEPTLIRPWTQRIVDAWNSIPDLERALHDLSQLRVLDPACGCGNFLYMAYREMRRLERRIAARIEERRRGGRAGTYGLSIVSVDQFQGMDINAFACEVAKVTLMIAKKLSADELDDDANVLPLDNLESNIREADALFTDWPAFDICIGNPPYLGRRRVIEERGAEYSSKLARAYPLISGVSDYVCYWFRFAHDKMPLGGRAGLVGTNSIREGQSRQASLDYVVDNGGVITDAVSSLKWDGTAQVNVSIVNWVKNDDGASKVLWLQEAQVRREVDWIYPDLTADLDLRSARPLRVNTRPKRCFQGQTPGHVKGFVLSNDESVRARQAGGAGSVVRPFITGDDLNNSGRPERWIIDFDVEDAATAKALDHAAFEQVKRLVLPDRIARAAKEEKANQAILAKDSCARVNWHHRNFLARWWQLSYRRADLLRALRPLDRYIALSRYAIADRPSVYAFLSTDIRPSDKVVAFAFDDDYSFGILTSSLHRLWFERRCTTLGQAVTYTNSTVFDTFPWPQNPTIEQVERIISVVARLQVHREERVAAGLTLGAQYDALRLPGQNRLRDLHTELDDCVRNAYGFEHPAEDLASLLALNELMVREELGGGLVRGPGPVANVQCKGTTVRVLG